MKRTTLRAVTVGAVACVVALASTISDAHAGWGSYGSSGGSYGSSGGSSGGWYGSSGGYSSSGGSSGYSSSGGSSGGWGHGGHHGGLFARWHARWHNHHSYSSSGGSYGSSGGGYGSSGGSSGGWGSSGGNYGSSGGSSGGSYSSYSKGEVYYSSPVQSDKGTIIESAPVEEEVLKPTSASLTVRVPDEALVFVNGIQTKSTGGERTYISRGLETGFNYTYEVRAEVTRDGQKVEETKVVALQAGKDARLSFELDGDSVAPQTTLTLNVPEDAKVFLSDSETKGIGAVREFTTTKLAAGQSWDNYTVRVAVERDGNVETREKTISLKAGENQSLSFDFEAPQVAALANE